MSALLFIQDKRKVLQKIEFVSMVRLAINGAPRDVEKSLVKWARHAEINLTFED